LDKDSEVMEWQNNQLAEKVFFKETPDLDVIKIFRTIQGEGPFIGIPSIFIRLAGCNLQCHFCDTDYTTNRQLIAIPEIVAKVNELRNPSSLIVITGGEPFRQPIGPLVSELYETGNTVQIETNGTIAPPEATFPYDICFICCSPKTPKVHKDLIPHIHSYKYVLRDGKIEDDGLPSSILGSHRPARPPSGFSGEIFVQPMDESAPSFGFDLDGESEERYEANKQATIESAMQHGYRMTVQMHKELMDLI